MFFLSDVENSSVHGIITNDGFFEGTVTTPSEEYHIEPITRYLEPNQTQHTSHSIIYKSSDVQDPRNGLTCASQLLHQKSHQNTYHEGKHRGRRWLLEAEAKLPYDDVNFWTPNKAKPSPPLVPPFDLNNPYNQPIDEELDMMVTPNRTAADLTGIIFRNVNKRAIIDPKKTTCMLYLQADHQFFQKYGTEEACIEVMTRHVQRVNAIYKNTGM